MIRFFKTSQAATLFFIPVIVLLLWAQALLGHPLSDQQAGMPIFNVFLYFLSGLPFFIRILIGIALISIEAIYLNVLLNRHEVLYKNSYLPALMYALLMSLASAHLQFHPLILANLFLIVALDRIFSLFKNESPISTLFDSGFFISIASLVYFPAVTLFPLFLIALIIIRPFNLREWMIAFIGFFLPWFFFSVYLFWTDQMIRGWKNIFANAVPSVSRFGFTMDKPLAALFIFLGILLLLSMYGLWRNFYKNVIRTRVNQQILVLYFFVALASTFFIRIVPLYHSTILAIPLAVFFGNYFLSTRKKPWISEFILWLMIILIIRNHF